MDPATSQIMIDGVRFSPTALILVAKDWIRQGKVLALFTVEGDTLHVQEVRDGEVIELAEVAIAQGGELQ